MSNGPNENVPSPTQNIEQTRKEKFKTFLRIGLMIFFEVVLPIALYFILEKHIRETWALVISGVPPFIVVVYGLIRNRRVDILGVIIVLGFVVDAIVTLIKDDSRLYLLRESTTTGTIGLIFLISLIPIKIGSFQMRPLIFYLGKDMETGGTFGSNGKLPGLTKDEPISERWDRHWKSYPSFRRGFIIMTAVWGLGLLIEVPIRVIIVFKSISTEQAVFLTNVIACSWIALLVLFNIYYSKKMGKDKTMADQTPE